MEKRAEVVGVRSGDFLTSPKDTDISVRSFLAQRGMKKGDLSKFIEDAVKWRVLDQTMSEARSKFSDLPSDELDVLLQEAVTASRKATSGDAG